MGAPVDMVPKFAVDTLKSCLDDPSIHTYSTPKGEKFFTEAVIERMKSRFNVDIKQDEVFLPYRFKRRYCKPYQGIN